MIFLDKIHTLKSSYSNKECETHKNVVLYGIKQSPPPLADHFIFTSLSDSLVHELIDSYKGIIPQELLEIYHEMNGAHLFSSKRYIEAIKGYLPYYQLSVFGMQIRYSENHYVQYDISLEDSSRPKSIPRNWLKFACYHKPGNSSDIHDLFVETNTGKVFSQLHHDSQGKTIESWNSIDECLCDIFDLLSEHFNK